METWIMGSWEPAAQPKGCGSETLRLKSHAPFFYSTFWSGIRDTPINYLFVIIFDSSLDSGMISSTFLIVPELPIQ